MSCIVGLLRNLCPEVERELKQNLQGAKGLVGQGFLPQFWVLETETETVTFMIDVQGRAYAQTGSVPNIEVTIRWKHDLLASVLRTRDRTSVPSGVNPTVVTHTPRGQAAFDYLRGRLGL